MSRLSLTRATGFVENAVHLGRDEGIQPLGVAAFDPDGHLLSFQRDDGAFMTPMPGDVLFAGTPGKLRSVDKGDVIAA